MRHAGQDALTLAGLSQVLDDRRAQRQHRRRLGPRRDQRLGAQQDQDQDQDQEPELHAWPHDTPYLTEGSSGLTFAVDRFKGWPHSGHLTLARGERSRLADFASKVL